MEWKYTLKCPTQTDDYVQKGRDLGCVEGKEYHCMLDEKGSLGEVCKSRTWIQPEFCPEYNTVARRVDVFKCEVKKGVCPPATYWSNTSYQYSGCLYTQRMGTTTKKDEEIENGSGSGVNITLLGGLLTVAVLVVIIAIVIIWCRKHRRRHGETSYSAVYATISERGATKKQERPTQKVADLFNKGLYLISKHRDDTSYIRTMSVDVAKETLDDIGIVTFVGIVGSGKTKAAFETASVWMKEDEAKRQCVVLSKNDLVGIPWSTMRHTCVILDDVFTRWMIESKQVQLSSFCLDLYKHQTTTEKKIKVIVTIDKLILERHELVLKQFQFLKEEFRVVLSLDKNEQICILRSHFKNGKIIRDRKKENVCEGDGTKPDKNDTNQSALEALSPDDKGNTSEEKESETIAQYSESNLSSEHSDSFRDEAENKTQNEQLLHEQVKPEQDVEKTHDEKETAKDSFETEEQLLPKSRIETLSAYQYDTVGFPSICFMFSNILECFEQGDIFLTHCHLRLGAHMIENVLDNMKTCCLVYAVLHDGVFDTNNIDDDHLAEIAKEFKVKDASKDNMTLSLHEMGGTFFLEVTSNSFHMCARAIRVAFINYLSKRKEDMFARLCSSEIIKEYIRGEDYKLTPGEIIIKAKGGFLQSIGRRIHELISQDEDLSYHPLMKSMKI